MPPLLLLLACAGPSDGAKDTGGADSDSAVDTGDSAETGDSDTSGEDTSDTSSDSGTDSDTAETGEETGPVDADGDGYLSDVDCDDADPRTWPGAPEWCDPEDHDCDGAPLSPGVCGEMQDPDGAGRIVALDAVHLVGDLTGDGMNDGILIGPTNYPTPGGGSGFGMGVYAGGVMPSPPWDAPDGALHVWSEGAQTCMADVTPREIGDATGDGWVDMVFISHDCDWAIYVQPGPVATDGAAQWMDDTPYQWTATVPDPENWMWHSAWGGDFDGDGLSDGVGSEGGISKDTPAPSLFDVFFGGTWGETTVRVFSGATDASPYLDVLGDLDGDGLDEVHVLRPAGDGGSRHFLVSGALLRGADGALVEDLAYASILAYDDSPTGPIAQEGGFQGAGDWTGDGTNDLLIVARQSSTVIDEAGELFVVDGTTTGEFTLDAASVGSWVGNVEGGHMYFLGTLDADSEPGREVIAVDGDAFYLIQHQLPAPRTPMTGIQFPPTLIPHGAPRDFDGDGRDDWAFGNRDTNTGNLYLGWDIPWDEPEWW